MSDATDDLDLEGNSTERTPKGLRDAYDALKVKAAEAEAERDQLRSQLRNSTIADVLRDAKADPRLAKYAALNITGDVTSEAVQKWLTDEGELFGYKPAAAEEEVQAPDGAEAISEATSSAGPAPTGWTAERLRSASFDELRAAGIIPG